MSQNEMATTYDPATVEDKWYQFWMENDYFSGDIKEGAEAFSIVMPPPNVTGQLHIGHALDNTQQDILTRWKRMQGYSTLWVPGTDHASIATEVKVVDKMREEEGLEKEDVGRAGFLERAWAWKEEYGGRITEQLKKLGTSCDWSRERFTMDEACSKAVTEAFIRLYEEGLIYRGDYIINWCPDCKTTLSDVEVEHEEIAGHFYHLVYELQDSSEQLIVATTRPETMLGDTAIAVNPDDERYQHLIGETAILPILERELPIVADEFVDAEFGTGLVKVTPAHDPNDFEIGQRHDLELIKVIDDHGVMTEAAGKYQGFDRYQCREELVADLKAQGKLVEVEEHDHAVGHCYRCDTVIEPLVSKQWFVKMEPLAEPAIAAVKEGETDFIPERFTKVYLNWMENIRDWCISRQLWWGHRIPVWYCQDCEAEIVARQEPSDCTECGSEELAQDEDVLDTWFSSALWPFSTLGWPEKTEELEFYYPTSVLVTGRDIIFFWVARMIFSGLEFKDEAPFSDVLVHGLVRDAQGRKMSKSLGNGVDPLEFIDEYGADTLRFTLITGNTPGNDMRFRQEKVAASRNFVNKIWNASRFVLMNLEDFEPTEVEELNYTLADRWIISRLQQTAEEVTTALEKYQLGNAAQALYDFMWNEFCDWYIELIKPRLYQEEDTVAKSTAQYVASSVLEKTLRLLHPFMPFITEEIWQRLPQQGESIMLADWVSAEEEKLDQQAEEQMNVLMDVIRAIRNIRNEMKVNPGREITAILHPRSADRAEILVNGREYIADLAKVSEMSIKEELKEKPTQASTAVTNGVEVILPLAGMVDIDKEIARLEEELEEVEFEINRAQGKLANEGFVNNAPEELVEKEKEKVVQYKDKKEQLLDRLEMLNS
ncbi:valine--tRNA ligase [Fuchsiella alkaliacetigena]|uniref:valine--tRNA ligase n=1 Tax=Fuchsiella alkaliacetigena TaxID=957042 RepID=UPI00200A3FD4|nr:valine--tRNA ligase [Fuchsiella alkaliacetigena]MCK8824428.1 valine--tRNA ligase [Fuchsiella alkaliacetigena]